MTAPEMPPDAVQTPSTPPDIGELLLIVQDHDTAVARLTRRRQALPERVELLAIEARLADVGTRQVQATGRRDDLVARQQDLEAQVGVFDTRRHELEQRLYSARGASARDLQALESEIHHLRDRSAELEESQVSLLEEQEPLEKALEDLAAERAQNQALATTLRTALADAENVIDSELDDVRAERIRDAAGLPADVAARYDVLRERLGGVGAARLVGNRCEGCHLALPSMEVDRLRRLPPGDIVTCEQCGRILVRPQPQSA